jgi:hypothetical protein
MARKLYGVFCGTKWGMTYSKRTAIRATKAQMKKTGLEGEVRAMNDPSSSSWDSPTFRVCSERIWPSPAPAVLPRAVA